MRSNKSLLFMMLLMITLVASAAEKVRAMNDIDVFEWERRILLLSSENDMEKTISRLNDADYEIRDRHIYWFILAETKVISNYQGEIGESFGSNMRKKYFGNESGSVVLIGKDGGVKRRALRLDLNNLFALIDTMPMRQSEMAGRQ